MKEWKTYVAILSSLLAAATAGLADKGTGWGEVKQSVTQEDEALVPAAKSPIAEAKGLWLYNPYGIHPNAPTPKIAGNTTFAESYEEGIWTGTFDGVSTEEGVVVIHGSGKWSFNSTVTLEISVDGQSGTVVMSVVGQYPEGGEWSGKWVLISGTGELADLRGQGDWWGPGYGSPVPVPGEPTIDCGFEIPFPGEDPWEGAPPPPAPYDYRLDERYYGQICYSGSIHFGPDE